MRENRAICALDLQINKVYDFEIVMILKTNSPIREEWFKWWSCLRKMLGTGLQFIWSKIRSRRP